MKKSLIYGIASLAMLAGATACSDSKDDPKDVAGTPQVNDLHFDIFVTLDGAGGMNSQSSILVLSVIPLKTRMRSMTLSTQARISPPAFMKSQSPRGSTTI